MIIHIIFMWDLKFIINDVCGILAGNLLVLLSNLKIFTISNQNYDKINLELSNI